MKTAFETKYYMCQPNGLMMILMVLIGAVGAIVYIYVAFTGGDVSLLRGAFELTGGAALFVASLFSVLFLGVAALGIAGTANSFGAPMQVILGPQSILAPKSMFSSKITEIPYVNVTGLSQQRVKGGHILMIVQGRDAKVAINKSTMVDKAQFNELFAELERRCA